MRAFLFVRLLWCRGLPFVDYPSILPVMKKPLICLGSASPRRSELLHQIAVTHVIRCADIDETPQLNELPEHYVVRMALEKGRVVLAQTGANLPVLPVLAADTVVVLDGKIMGKPCGQADGLAMLRSLSGRCHKVMTAVALLAPGHEASCLSISDVEFCAMSEADMLAYWYTGEPADKAGGYGVQGYAATFIKNIEGSFSGVMGLPLFETGQLLRGFGINVCEACWPG